MKELTPDQLFDRITVLNEIKHEYEQEIVVICERIENLTQIYKELTKPGFKTKRSKSLRKLS